MKTITALADIIDAYDAILCDIWGVLHSGGAVFPAASHALTAAHQKGKRIILISNAPYLSKQVPIYLAPKGFSVDILDGIVTAGDITRKALATAPLGQRCFFIGTPRDHALLEGSSIQITPIEQADFALVAGVEEDIEAYADLLRHLRQANMPLVCANPDHVVRIGDAFFPCAGAFAHAYEQLGGSVTYYGKPHPAIYDQALAWAGVPPSACLAIGDSRSTDIQGACQAGIPSLFIAGGIHTSECFYADGHTLDETKTRQLFTPPIAPTYIMGRLA